MPFGSIIFDNLVAIFMKQDKAKHVKCVLVKFMLTVIYYFIYYQSDEI